MCAAAAGACAPVMQQLSAVLPRAVPCRAVCVGAAILLQCCRVQGMITQHTHITPRVVGAEVMSEV